MLLTLWPQFTPGNKSNSKYTLGYFLSNGTFGSAMLLQYLRFKDHDKCVLYVYFGEEGDKIYGLKSIDIPTNESDQLKTFKNTNNQQATINWLKTFMPLTYKNAYKEHDKNDFIVMTSHIVSFC
jgi:hypothetical protein